MRVSQRRAPSFACRDRTPATQFLHYLSPLPAHAYAAVGLNDPSSLKVESETPCLPPLTLQPTNQRCLGASNSHVVSCQLKFAPQKLQKSTAASGRTADTNRRNEAQTVTMICPSGLHGMTLLTCAAPRTRLAVVTSELGNPSMHAASLLAAWCYLALPPSSLRQNTHCLSSALTLTKCCAHAKM